MHSIEYEMIITLLMIQLALYFWNTQIKKKKFWSVNAKMISSNKSFYYKTIISNKLKSILISGPV